jgi:hypothetical protein
MKTHPNSNQAKFSSAFLSGCFSQFKKNQYSTFDLLYTRTSQSHRYNEKAEREYNSKILPASIIQITSAPPVSRHSYDQYSPGIFDKDPPKG